MAPVQVRILEQGHALVQYDPGEIDADTVVGLADVGAVVAPGTDLPGPVVVTAWTWKLTCDDVDAERITRFIENRTNDAPGGD